MTIPILFGNLAAPPSVCKPTTKMEEALCISNIALQSSFPYDVSQKFKCWHSSDLYID
uniref:Uncharacterized protein n=1 Tax=Manihot esculenta TaxID=3983 RepID=A0A2C9VM15_MANES